jgi:hypothetical protein
VEYLEWDGAEKAKRTKESAGKEISRCALVDVLDLNIKRSTKRPVSQTRKEQRHLCKYKGGNCFCVSATDSTSRK